MFWKRKKDTAPPPAPTAPAPSGLTGDSDGDVSAEFLTGDSALDRKSVEVLLGAIAQVSGSRDLEGLLIDIVDRSIEITDAERGLLILAPEDASDPLDPLDPECLELRVARGRDGQGIQEDIRFSTSVVKRVLEEDKPVRATVQSDSDALELGRSVFDLKLRAVMCVPLQAAPGDAEGEGAEKRSDARSRGVLYVDSRAATREFGPRDLGLFAALSQHISIALENARLHLHSLEKTRLENSLELASAIQEGLMPPIPKDIEGWEVHGWYRPAERTSGDFFDFVTTREKHLCVIVGDVTGHGIGPALVTATAQASLRSFLRVVSEPAEAVTLLNQDLSERMDAGMFLTLLVLAMKADGGIDIINAGHHAPFLWRKATGEIDTPEGHGTALGMIADAGYEVDVSVELASGDVLLAFTDGLIEAPSVIDRDQLFGEERTRELFAKLCADGASTMEIAQAIAEEALSFSGQSHEDDITLVVVRKQ